MALTDHATGAALHSDVAYVPDSPGHPTLMKRPWRDAQAPVRMAAYRKHRKAGLRCVLIQVRDEEVDGLIGHGFLVQTDRCNAGAIAVALGRLLDELPPHRWLVVPRRALLSS